MWENVIFMGNIFIFVLGEGMSNFRPPKPFENVILEQFWDHLTQAEFYAVQVFTHENFPYL